MEARIYIAVSACLLGEACRYDGASKPSPPVQGLADLPGVELVPICPEVAGGLPTPRAASEIVRMPDGAARVKTRDGTDNTAAFVAGAHAVLETCREHGCETAVLKSKSPSCGSGTIYDGTFSGALVPGWGIAAQLLRDAGIAVVDEDGIEAVLDDVANL